MRVFWNFQNGQSGHLNLAPHPVYENQINPLMMMPDINTHKKAVSNRMVAEMRQNCELGKSHDLNVDGTPPWLVL